MKLKTMNKQPSIPMRFFTFILDVSKYVMLSPNELLFLNVLIIVLNVAELLRKHMWKKIELYWETHAKKLLQQ